MLEYAIPFRSPYLRVDALERVLNVSRKIGNAGVVQSSMKAVLSLFARVLQDHSYSQWLQLN